jgi:predicted 2-oxoglutarate/Fe(II)-dependent dioxygenase YbiX
MQDLPTGNRYGAGNKAMQSAKAAVRVAEDHPRIGLCEPQAHCVFTTYLLNSVECAEIVRHVQHIDAWNAARVNTGGDEESRGAVLPNVRTALIADHAQSRDLHDQFERKVRRLIRRLIEQYWGLDLPRCEGTQLIRYKAGAHYIPHKDSDDMEFASRYFTVLCYLNEDFQGGCTYFPSLNYRVKPASGKTVVFPSQFVHAAEPVTQGEKFALLTWMSGPVPIRWI